MAISTEGWIGGETGPDHRRLVARRWREIAAGSRAAVLVVAAASFVASAAVSIGAPSAAPTVLAIGWLNGGAALAAWLLIRRRLRRHLIAVDFTVGLSSVCAALTTAAVAPTSSGLMIELVAMAPVLAAILIRWPVRFHLAWLASTAAVVAAFGLAAGAAEGLGRHRIELLVGSGVSAVASAYASWLAEEARSGAERQLVEARALYRRAGEQRLDLQRQDSFLMLQQETLVAQQEELLRLNEQLASMARMDALTGLGNRLRLNEDLVVLGAALNRHGGSAAVLILDLDRFKRLNDEAGHLAGDDALRRVAGALRGVVRADDRVYRYGGEEFLFVLERCDEDSLAAVAARVVAAVEDARIAHPDNPPWAVVTASAGIAAITSGDPSAIHRALLDADAALYRAKGKGRNRAETADDSARPRTGPRRQARGASPAHGGGSPAHAGGGPSVR